jgi:hypothetical protein
MILFPIKRLMSKARAAAKEALKVINRKAPAPLRSQALSKYSKR